jgi:hypothetical protein
MALASSQVLRAVVAVIAMAGGTPVPAVADQAKLGEARRLYNAGRYEAAMAEAAPLVEMPGLRPAALLVLGRAGLERFRQTAEPVDLSRAREALRAIDASSLEPRDRLELIVGLGEALYLEESFNAAAQVFDMAIGHAQDLGTQSRDQLLDWWATALDRYAQTRPWGERLAIYRRVLDEMRAELGRDAGSAAASYWIAAGYRARGETDAAWDAAMSAWVRAQLTPDRGASLRPDIDRLVLQGIIPDRARRLTSPPADLEQAITTMAAEWDAFKQRWASAP